MKILDMQFTVIEINIPLSEVETKFLIKDINHKKEIIRIMDITYKCFEKTTEYRTITIKYGKRGAVQKRKEIKEKVENFFPYSLKEFILTTEQLNRIIQIIEPGMFYGIPDNKLWKLCLTKSINQEFLE